MIEEVLKHVVDYTDDLMMDLLKDESSLADAIGEMCKVFADIFTNKIGRSPESVNIFRNYFLTLIKSPDIFNFSGEQRNNTVEILYNECVRNKVCITSLLDETEVSEEILAVLMSTMCCRSGNKKAKEREIDAQKNISAHEKFLSLKISQKVLKKRSIWGLEPVDDADKLSAWVYAQCELSSLFRKPDYPYILRLCPMYFEAIQINSVYTQYPEFFKKTPAEIEASRGSMGRIIETTCNKLFVLMKSLILSDKTIKKNFIESVYTIYKQNKDREKTKYNLKTVLSDDKIFTISNMLSKFIVPIVGDVEKMKKIPLDLLQNCKYLKNIEYTGINGALEGGKSKNFEEESFLSQVFYAKILFNQISYIPVCINYNEYQTDIARSNRALLVAQPEERENLKKVISVLQSEFEYVQTLLSVQNIVKMEETVIMYTVSFLNSAINREDFFTMPTFILESTLLILERLIHVQQAFGRLTPTELRVDEIHKIYRLASLVLKQKGVNINYKQEALRLLSAYAESALYVQGTVTAIVGYCIELQSEIRNITEKLEERGRIASTLKSLLVDYKAKQEMLNILQPAHISTKKDHMDTKTVFLLHMSSALIDAQERGFDELRKISQAEKTLESAAEEDRMGIESSIANMVEISNGCFYVVQVIEEILFILLELCPSAFFSSLVVNRFASMLNASIISLAGSKAKELKIRKKNSSRFSPVEHLRARLKMYIDLRSASFVRAVAEDNGMFKPLLFKNAIDICERKGCLTQSEKAYCLLFIQTVENLQNQKKDSTEDIEYPEEFVDPLTYGIMKDPVILRTSNTRVDRSTAAMILMNDPIDPFTRNKLTEEDIVTDLELKEKIDQFLIKIQLEK
ncbi:ubiquitin conjugation factor E4 B [Nematocida minor]|uniref:ubiquitin conjugation factor E4 B n=1 Tax=Nematocida minor TaxID=1912983 RepID=UPI00221F69CD|nr:ubiquitin conjugation factor E4 B [Nematocida minor]KAI5190007.1 ubiquitin conjugation factor E4 B [Nematocida minor]